MIKPYFKWTAYRGTWNRVLHAPGVNHGEFKITDGFAANAYIELNLTPVNGWPSEMDDQKYRNYKLDQVRNIRIRCHVTPRSDKDEIWANLPEHVREGMLDNLGFTLTQRLLTEDFLPQMDFDLYRLHCNGGANFEDIRRVFKNFV